MRASAGAVRRRRAAHRLAWPHCGGRGAEGQGHRMRRPVAAPHSARLAPLLPRLPRASHGTAAQDDAVRAARRVAGVLSDAPSTVRAASLARSQRSLPHGPLERHPRPSGPRAALQDAPLTGSSEESAPSVLTSACAWAAIYCRGAASTVAGHGCVRKQRVACSITQLLSVCVCSVLIAATRDGERPAERSDGPPCLLNLQIGQYVPLTRTIVRAV